MSRDSERSEIGRLRDLPGLGRLWPLLRPYRLSLLVMLAVMVLIVAGDMAKPWFVKNFVDGGLQTGQWAGTWQWIRYYALVALVGGVLSIITGYIALGTGQRLAADLRRLLYRRFQRLPLAYFDRSPAGKILARMVNDPESVGEPVAMGVIFLSRNGLTVIGMAVLMLVLNWRLALAALALLPVTLFIGAVCRPAFLRAYRWCREMVSNLNMRMEEQISGHNTLVLLGQEARAASELDEANDLHRRAWVRTGYLHIFFSPLIQMTFDVGAGLLMWYGGSAVLKMEVSAGDMIMFGMYLQEMSWPLVEMLDQVQQLQSSLAALERIFKFLDAPEEDYPAEAAGEKVSDTFSPAAARGHGEIEFRDVWFAYRSEEWVLRGLSFKVRAGERVALVGPTGSGKTTVLSLASALYRPQRGQVLLDGADLAARDPREVRRQIATVVQDVFLFAGTAAENVRLWEPGFDAARVEAAARQARAHEFIVRLPGGYEHALGERAQTLSAGQRQLISFARALCFDPPVLLLDEATSSVDAQTEELIRQGLSAITKGRTSIIVAHRYSTLAGADRAMVLAGGRIIEDGPPAEVLDRHRLRWPEEPRS